MSDIVVGVRLQADGSGLIGQLKLSRAEMDQLRTSEQGAAGAARDLSDATDQVAKSQARAAQGAKQASGAVDQLTKNVGLQRAGWQQVGFQVQDVFASYASGSRLSVIFAQQSGQLASAIALIAQSAEGGKGKLAGLASFLGGPWGIAIGIAVSVGTALVSTLLQAEDAADKVKFSTSALSDSQTILASVLDIATGKMKSQTDAALGLAFAQAQLNRVRAQADAAKYRSEVGALQDPSYKLQAGFGGGLSYSDTAPGAQKSIARDVLARLNDPTGKAGISTADAVQRLDNLRKVGALTDDAYAKAAASVANLGVELENIKISDATVRMLQGEGSASDRRLLLKPEKPKKDHSAEKAAREAQRLADFSDRAAEAVARINDEYNTAPRDIDRARQATAQLDGVVKDVNERLARAKNLTADQRAGFAAIKAEAERLKPVIQQSLVRPMLDMIDGQQRQIDLGKLQLSGRQADADALQLTFSLMDKMGAKTQEQLATELAKRGVTEDQVRVLYGNLDVLRQQTREMRVQQRVLDTWLGAVGDMRENVRLTIQDLRREGPKALGDFAKRSLDVFDRLFSEVAVEKLFGGLFRDLEDQLTGGDKASNAGDRLAAAVGRASKDMDTASSAIVDLGKAATGAAADIRAGKSGGDAPLSSGAAGAPDGDRGAEIVVTGIKNSFKSGFDGVFDNFKAGLDRTFSNIFGDKGLFSGSLSKTLGETFGHAALGGSAGSLATGLLGVRGSSTGGMLGGAIGGELGKEFLGKLGSFAGPLGSVAGGIIGSVVGGLLKKTQTGSANITSGSGAATLSGNSSAFKQAASGAAESVQDGLSQIASQLGGAIGAFNVTIGQRHGDWRVRSGTGSLKVAKGAKEFDDDQAGAVAYAIQLAVSQGAVTGLSSAINQALRSSPDIDKALAEALKVQEVENLLSGLGTQMASQFKAFEAQAKERVRIASQYGFDVVAIEKKNAEDRVKLVDQLLTDRVGSLQTLLADMKSGDLFEGSAVDRRTALLSEIASVKAKAEAGEDGAADKLAALVRQLIDTTKEDFGTAGGELTSDRATAISAAESVIKAENDRIRAAQDAATGTTEQLASISTKTDETNDLLAKIAGDIATIANGGSGGGSIVLDTDLVAIGR